MRGERIAAPIFALLIVLSGAGGAIAPGASPVGVAAAADTECDTLDALWYDMVNVGDWKLAGGGCNEDVKTVQAQSNLQQKVDLNQLGADSREGREPVFTKINNSLDSSGSVVSMRARATVVEMLNNGTTDTTKIKNEVDKEINNYYALRQANLVETYKAHAHQTHYIINASVDDPDIANDFVKFTLPEGYSGDIYYQDADADRWVKHNVTLSNGTTKKVIALDFVRGYTTDSDATRDISMAQPTQGDRWTGKVYVSAVSDPALDQNVSQRLVIDVLKYHNTMQAMRDKAEQMRQNYGTQYIDNIIQEYEAGQLNTSEMVTPEMMVQEFGTEPGESGYLGYQVAMTSFMGVSSPEDLNASMEITAESATVLSGEYFSGEDQTVSNYNAEGLIFAESAPNGSFTVGQTYNADTLSGPVWFVNATSARRVSISGNFTVESASDASGNQLQQVSLNQKNREVYDAGEFVNKTKKQQTVRLQIEREYQPAGGTGGSGGGSSNPLSGLLGPLASLLGIGTGATMLILIGGGLVAYRVYTP